MKKRLLLILCLPFLSQVCMAGIIIDLDAYIYRPLEILAFQQCGEQGCSFPLVAGSGGSMMVSSANGWNKTFVFQIWGKGSDGNWNIGVNGVHYPNQNSQENISFALPGLPCYATGQTILGFIRLRYCDWEGEVAYVYFIQESGTLRVQLYGLQPGLTLYKVTSSTIGNEGLLVQPDPTIKTASNGTSEDRVVGNNTQEVSTIISPNPFSQSILVQAVVDLTETVTLSLFDLKGRMLQTQTFTGGQAGYPLPTEDIPDGLYFLRVQVAERIETHQVVKIE